MSESIGCVKDNLFRLSLQTESSYEEHLSEAVESKLYYLRDTCTPAEFADLVEAELQRIREKSQGESHTSLGVLMRSLKRKISRIFH
jgi:hypothetical protein